VNLFVREGSQSPRPPKQSGGTRALGIEKKSARTKKAANEANSKERAWNPPLQRRRSGEMRLVLGVESGVAVMDGAVAGLGSQGFLDGGNF
jgi:hypothetical protein